MDAAGQSIVQLLHKAAGAAEANSRKALDLAQKLSQQLRAAEERINELEAEAEAYRQKKASGRSNGCIECTPRLTIDFSRKRIAVERDRHYGVERKARF